jgi:hypothetical protein
MANGSHLTLRIYKHPVPGGGSQPHVLGASDGNDYLVKFKNNPQGTRVLVNEYVVNELISKLGFEGGRGQIVSADAFFLSNQPNLKNLDAGLQFASPYHQHHDNFSDTLLDRMKNRDKLPQVPILDTFICNVDRASGNLLIVFDDPTKLDCRFVLIDHGHAFGGPDWDEHKLKTLQNSTNSFANIINLSNIPRKMGVFEPFLLQLEALTPEDIEAIINTVPIDWGLHSADRKALLDFLVARKASVRQIISDQFGA